MLGDSLMELAVPSDGSARLASVKIDVVDGLKQWTVVYREVPQKLAAPPPAPLTLAAAPVATPSAPVSPSKVVAFQAPAKKEQASDDMSMIPHALAPVPAAPKKVVDATAPPTTSSKLMADRVFPLKCPVKTYAWGKLGAASLCGALAEAGLEELDLCDRTPYAELWMGTHPSGPAMVMLAAPWRTITPLSEWIKLNPSLLGPARMKAEVDPKQPGAPKIERRKSMLRLSASSLPFLFKILSVRTALSIQAHPDKVLAAQLHARHPDQYKDDNHKPEMTVAITTFEALSSFQPAYSILENLRATPELSALIGEDAVNMLDNAANARAAAEHAAERSLSPMTPTSQAERERRLSKEDQKDVRAGFKLALREVFSKLMNAPAEEVKKQLEALMKRVASTNKMLRAPVDVLAMRLHEQYPADVGVFCVYLLNYCTLQPGQALFLAANEPHAYISGDCAEVMATSDNVVRAGCTPKWKDVETLVDMLTYEDGTPMWVEPQSTSANPHVFKYMPPEGYDEFMLERVELPADGVGASLGAQSGLAILIVVKGAVSVDQFDADTEETIGQTYQLTTGAIHLICPHTMLKMRADGGPVLLFRAAAKDGKGVEPPADLNTGLTLS